MVGRMIREAVENMIDDVKESIEEQGRQADQVRQAQRSGPMARLEPPPPAYQPPSPASRPAPTVPAPSVQQAVPERAIPERVVPERAVAVPRTPPRSVAAPPPTGDDGDRDEPAAADATAETDDGPEIAVDPGEAISRLEADVETARELYREARSELREARRAARLETRDERRDRRYERRSPTGVDGER